MATKTEVERKYDVPVDFALPDLTGLSGVSAVGDPAEHRLDATYFDTPGLRLAANRVTLRRRTGGSDPGWHVKHPAGGADARSEAQFPLRGRADDVPREARDAVRDASGGEPLSPVARIRTRRVERPLRDDRGRVLALLADDVVSSNAPGDRAVVQRWRELEVELVDGSHALLETLDVALRAAGARPAGVESKLARALAERYPDRPAGTGAAQAPDEATGEPLDQYVRAQIGAIRTNEAGVRRADPDAVHDMRVATRRLRSTLRTFRPLLDRDRTEPLRAELQWLGRRLGGVRDGQVMADRLATAVAALRPELVIGPVTARIRAVLAAETAEAHRRLTAALDGGRYAAMLESLDRLAADQLRHRRRPRRLRRLARRALRRADRRLRAADDARPADRDARLHDARKAYKRARYAAEALVPLAGKPARRLGRRISALQDVLGAHQDVAVTGQRLRELGMRAHAGGDNAFTYGLLHGRQYSSDEYRLVGFGEARARVEKPKLRRWLKK
jgi:CHAD domain-containing protein